MNSEIIEEIKRKGKVKWTHIVFDSEAIEQIGIANRKVNYVEEIISESEIEKQARKQARRLKREERRKRKELEKQARRLEREEQRREKLRKDIQNLGVNRLSIEQGRRQLEGEIVQKVSGGYSISNLGRVFGKHGRILKQKKDIGGYPVVGLLLNGKAKQYRVHRLVAICFIENPHPELYTVVDHINSNRSDARAENLRWCTQKQNIQWAREARMTSKKVYQSN